MIYHLKIGSLGEAIDRAKDSDSSIERDALLVYTGKFQSADGEVVVSDDQLSRLAANHNGILSKLKRLATGSTEIHAKHFPPIQLDHSTSAKDTIGRLIGDVELRETEVDGEKVKALFGRVRILGRENVERVLDGRWTNLSIGADFDEGYISEVTVTPFPAASDASLLSRKHELYSKLSSEEPMDKEKLKKHLMDKKNLSADEADKELSRLEAEENKEELSKLSEEIEKDELSSDADSDDNVNKLAKEEVVYNGHYMNWFVKVVRVGDKFYAYYGEKSPDRKSNHTHNSNSAAIRDAQDAIKYYIRAKKDESYFSSDDEKKEAKLTAAREKIKKLSIGFKQSLGATRLAAKQSTILNRLSKLRADGKITPAEIKKMDISKLSASSDEAISLVLQSYEDREPVIMAGMIGDSRSIDVSKITKQRKLSKLEAETRANMPFMSHVDKNVKRFAEGEKEENGSPDTVNIHVDTDPHTDLESEYGEIEKLMDDGKTDEAKKRLKGWLQKMKCLNGDSNEFTETNTKETEKQLSAIADAVSQLEARFDDLQKLASELVD